MKNLHINLPGEPVAVVTGASRGIGRAIALVLAAQGAKVVVNYANSPEAAEAVVKEIQDFGGGAIAIKADVSQASEVEAMIEQVMAKWQRIDVLVNNAGITRDGLLLRMKLEDWQKVIDLNLTGVFLCTKAVSKIMLKQKAGRIINITSVVGETGNAGQANYSAAKAGVIGFTKSVAKELASRGITVNAVAPGWVLTQKQKDLWVTPEGLQAHIDRQCLKDPLAPEDIVGGVLFLASQSSRMMTGQALVIDGGVVVTG